MLLIIATGILRQSGKYANAYFELGGIDYDNGDFDGSEGTRAALFEEFPWFGTASHLSAHRLTNLDSNTKICG